MIARRRRAHPRGARRGAGGRRCTRRCSSSSAAAPPTPTPIPTSPRSRACSGRASASAGRRRPIPASPSRWSSRRWRKPRGSATGASSCSPISCSPASWCERIYDADRRASPRAIRRSSSSRRPTSTTTRWCSTPSSSASTRSSPGANLMNCQMCKYREQVLGFEAEVGLPQESHHHHVEGIGTRARSLATAHDSLPPCGGGLGRRRQGRSRSRRHFPIPPAWRTVQATATPTPTHPHDARAAPPHDHAVTTMAMATPTTTAHPPPLPACRPSARAALDEGTEHPMSTTSAIRRRSPGAPSRSSRRKRDLAGAAGRHAAGGGADRPCLRHDRTSSPTSPSRQDAAEAGAAALRAGAPILCDVRDGGRGHHAARGCRRQNAIVVAGSMPRTPRRIAQAPARRPARRRRMELWRDKLDGRGRRDRQRADGAVPPAGARREPARRAPALVLGLPGRLRRRGGIEGGARRERARHPLHHAARPARRQRHGGRRRVTRSLGLGEADRVTQRLALRSSGSARTASPACRPRRARSSTAPRCWSAASAISPMPADATAQERIAWTSPLAGDDRARARHARPPRRPCSRPATRCITASARRSPAASRRTK